MLRVIGKRRVVHGGSWSSERRLSSVVCSARSSHAQRKKVLADKTSIARLAKAILASFSGKAPKSFFNLEILLKQPFII